MAQERIEELISKEALDSIDRLKEKVDQSTHSFEAAIEKAIQFNKAVSGSTNIKDFVNATKQADEGQKQLASTQQKLITSQGELAKETAKVQVQLQEQTKANKEAAREALGLNDAYKKLEQQAAAATKAAKNAGAQFGENSEQFKLASVEAKRLNDNLKAIDKSVGLNQRNVGNYSESFKVLEQELSNVTNKLSTAKQSFQNLNPIGFKLTGTGSTGNTTAEISQLTAQQAALQQVVSKSAVGFTSLTQELRTNERALQTLRAAGLADTEAFKQLQTQTNHTRKEFNDFAKQQKILSSDLPAITGLTTAAKGLAGAYAIGAGSAALFGDEQGKIEKEVQKLVAIMTVLNGLQEAHELLEQKDAIATALNTAAMQAYNFVVGESIGLMRVLKLAFAATGLGAIILLVSALISQFSKANNETKHFEDGLSNLTGVSDKTKEAIRKYGDTVSKVAEGAIKDLEKQVSDLNDELHQTASAVDVSNAALRLLGGEVDRIKSQYEGFNDLGKKTLKESLIDIASALGLSDDRLEEAQKNLDKAKKLSEERDALLSFKRLVKDNEDAVAIFQSQTITAAKVQQDANKKILEDETSGFTERRAAIKSNYAQELIIIQQSLNQQLIAAGADRAKRKEAEDKAKLDRIAATTSEYLTLLNLRRLYEDRNYKALQDIRERQLQGQIEFNKKAAEDDAQLPEIRIQALRNGLRDELKLLNEQEAKELHQRGLTAQETDNIYDKYNTLREAKEVEVGAKIFKLQVELVGKTKDLFTDLTTTTIQQLSKITDFLSKNMKKTIDNLNFNEFAAGVTDAVGTANDSLKKLAFTGDSVGKALRNLFQFKGSALNPKEVDSYVEGIKELEKQLSKLGSELISVGEAAVNAGFENQKNAIQEQINLIDKKRDHDIAAIQASQKSEQDKAAAIAIINARADSQKRLQEQRQKQIQIQQARFEKAVTLAKIIAETAAAVVHQFTSGDPYTAFARAVGCRCYRYCSGCCCRCYTITSIRRRYNVPPWR
jgi:hypothetical protein